MLAWRMHYGRSRISRSVPFWQFLPEFILPGRYSWNLYPQEGNFSSHPMAITQFLLCFFSDAGRKVFSQRQFCWAKVFRFPRLLQLSSPIFLLVGLLIICRYWQGCGSYCSCQKWCWDVPSDYDSVSPKWKVLLLCGFAPFYWQFSAPWLNIDSEILAYIAW